MMSLPPLAQIINNFHLFPFTSSSLVSQTKHPESEANYILQTELSCFPPDDMNKAGQFQTDMLDDGIFIPEQLPHESAFFNQFQDDGKLDTLEKLSHPNLVKLLGYSCKDGELEKKMKMESVENHLLRKDSANIEPLSLGTRYQIILEVAQSLWFLHSEKNIVHRDFKASNILLDGYQASLSDFGVTPNKFIAKVNAMDAGDAGDFMALDISSVLTQSEKTDMEIKMSRRECGAFGDKNKAEKVLKWGHHPSHLENNWPNMNIKKESQSNVYPTLLLIASLLSTITFLIALKIRGCRLEEGYKYISSLNPICQTVIQHPYVIRLVIAFNSIVFFLSITLMMILFNELPLRPLLLVCASSMLGAYMCLISGPSKPLLSSS